MNLQSDQSRPVVRLPIWRRFIRRLPLPIKLGLTRFGRSVGIALTLPPPPPAPPISEIRPGRILISGFFDDGRGIGRAADLTADALERAGFEVTRHNIAPSLKDAKNKPPYPSGGVWLICANPPELSLLLLLHPELQKAKVYRIGLWAWELPKAPQRWIEASRALHEIWAPSQFTALSLEGAACPVHVMPHPVPIAQPPLNDERAGKTRFLVFADFRSSLARKNPIGAIDAFKAAFAEGEAELVIKISGIDEDPRGEAMLRAAADRTDIKIIDQVMDRNGIERLIASASVLVSLHRSEGFGLTVAEAMAAGKPVIVTRFSGVEEYLPDDHVQSVPYQLVAVEDHTHRYSAQTWAEPDLKVAAKSMIQLAASEELAAELGESNRAGIAQLQNWWTGDALKQMAFVKFAI